MHMTNDEAIDWIHGRIKFGARPGLIRIQKLLSLLNNPENELAIIHIAGTNGKGSTVSYLRAMLQEVGLTVGTFTSPYIERFHERIAINGEPISEDDLVKYVEIIHPIVVQMDQDPEFSGITEFEIITALGFLYFSTTAVDVVVVEVGLGGLLDSTNVVSPFLTAITTIGMDHTDILGDTIEKIALQKAGILKQSVPVVTGKIGTEAFRVIEKVANQLDCQVDSFGNSYDVIYKHPDQNWGEVFDFTNTSGTIRGLKTPLLGRHQVENAGVAIHLFSIFCQLKGIVFKERDVREGLSKTYWPARMERIRTEPLIILDGAHNEHAMERLVENMNHEFPHRRIYILFSALETKDISTMLHQLLTIPNATLYLTSFDYPNALKLEKNYQLLDQSRIEIASLWPFALGEILEKIQEDDVILVTGSLYFVSEVRHLLKEI